MVDDATPEAPASLPRCMWCSAELPSDSETVCPSCGATLIGEGDTQVPGVTAIDAEAIVRAGRDSRAKRGSRLMSWISGEYEEAPEKPAAPGSLAPPPPDVRREILRLELAAQVANLQAEAGAMAAEHAVESGEPIDIPHIAAMVDAPPPAVAAGADAATPAADAAPSPPAESQPPA